MILAFEVLLKAALVASNRPPKRTHDYAYLWSRLSAEVQEQILAEAKDRMQSMADYSHLTEILADYQFAFEQARYYYQFYEDVTLEETSLVFSSRSETKEAGFELAATFGLGCARHLHSKESSQAHHPGLTGP